ncbi:MAG: hypothetical protein ACYC41_08860 [Bacillota bacterium]
MSFRHSRVSHALVWLVLAAIVTAGGPVPVAAQGGSPAPGATSAIKLTVVPGFGGQAKLSHWIPVEVVVENAGPDVAGELVYDRTENNGYRTEYVVDAVVPSGSKKTFLMNVPFTDLLHAVEVRLVSGQDELASGRGQLDVIATTDVTAGVLSNDPAALVQLGAVVLDAQKRRVTPVHLRPQQLSEHVAVLDNFDLLIFDNVNSAEITEAQWRAIEGWAGSGGVLVFAGGPNARKTLAGVPASLLPVEVDGTVTSGLSALGAFASKDGPSGTATISRVKVKPGATVQVAQGQQPLLVEQGLGSGHVLFFAGDLNLAPMADWAGNIALWTRLVNENLSARTLAANTVAMMKGGPPMTGGLRVSSSLAYGLRNLPMLDLPSLKLLGVLLLAYILLIGPLNYLVLRRLDRRELAWLTVPLLVILFAGSAYVFAFKGKGRDVTTNSMAIVRLDPTSSVARAQTYVGVFAPSRRSYRVTLEGAALVSPLTAYDGGMPLPASGGTGGSSTKGPLACRIKTGSQSTTIDFVDMRMWSMQSFMVDRGVTAPGTIDSNLHTEDDHIVGTVTNHSNLVLKDAFALSSFGYQSLGDIPPGQTVQVDFMQSVNNKGYYGGNAMLSQIMSQYAGIGQGKDDREMNRRRSILEGAFGWERDGRWDGDKVVVAGWVDKPIDQAVVGGKQGQDYYLAMVGAPAEVSVVNGKDVSIPYGLVQSTLVDSKSNSLSRNPDGYALSEGSMTFEFRLPVTPRRLSKMFIFMPNIQGGPAVNWKAEVYDWAKEKWVESPVDAGTIELGDNKAFVSPSGAVRLKITNPGGVWLNIGDPMVSVGGSVK